MNYNINNSSSWMICCFIGHGVFPKRERYKLTMASAYCHELNCPIGHSDLYITK